MTENKPNEYGFAGAATGPAPEPDDRSSDVEQAATPADDLTGSVSDALTDATTDDDGDGGGEPPD